MNIQSSLAMAPATLSGAYSLNSSQGVRQWALALYNKASRGRGWRRFWQRRGGALAQVSRGCSAGHDLGICEVALAHITGSEGRWHDFDSNFQPLTNLLQDRWVSVAEARLRGIPLPPVELIQVGDRFAVRDGHHRISVARALGQEVIEAHVVRQGVVA